MSNTLLLVVQQANTPKLRVSK